MFPGTGYSHSGNYSPHQHCYQPSASPFHFTNTIDTRRLSTENSSSLPYTPSTNGVMPDTFSIGRPGQGYNPLPLLPSPAGDPFTASSSAVYPGDPRGGLSIREYKSRFGQRSAFSPCPQPYAPPTDQPESPSSSTVCDPQTPPKSAERGPSIKTKTSWPSLTDALPSKKSMMPMLLASDSSPVKGDSSGRGARYSPLRGDAEFFTPRPHIYLQHAIPGSRNAHDVQRETTEDNVPLPRDYFQFANHNGTLQEGVGYTENGAEGARMLQATPSTITGSDIAPLDGNTVFQGIDRSQSEEDPALYHLLPAFSPFDDILELKSSLPNNPPGLATPRDDQAATIETRPLNSTALFSPFYPSAGEPKARSLLPSFKTTATSTSIWSTDTAAQTSPFSPTPAPADWNPLPNGDKGVPTQQLSPFSSNGADSKNNNVFSLEGLWDDSPVKQTSIKVSPPRGFSDYESPLLMVNGFPARTLSCMTCTEDRYSPSLKSQSAVGLQIDETSRPEPSVMVSVPLPPPPGLVQNGNTSVYSHNLLSIKEIEEKMQLLREQSSGLAGDLIQQAAKIQTKRLELESQWANMNRSASQPQAEIPLIGHQTASAAHDIGSTVPEAEQMNHGIIPVLLEGSADLFHASAVKLGAAGGEQIAIELIRQVEYAFKDVIKDGSGALQIVVHVVLSMNDITQQLVDSGVINEGRLFREFLEGFSYHTSLSSVTWCPSQDHSRDRLIAYLGLYWKTMRCSDIVLAVNETLGLEDIQAFMEASEGRPIRLSLCNPNLMALENTSVAFAYLNVPGIFISRNTLEITVEAQEEEEEEDDGSLSSDSEDAHTVKEDWEAPVNGSSSSDNEPLTPNTGVDSGLASEKPLVEATERKNSIDAFTPVVSRQRKNGQIDKLGVRLAVVTSDEFDRFHKFKSSPKNGRSRGQRSHRGTSVLKATAIAASAGTATYREVDYQNMKKLNPRPCHKHYLSVKGCPNGDDCAFGHHYELTKSELLAVRVLAREMPCPYHLNGGKCPHDVSSVQILAAFALD